MLLQHHQTPAFTPFPPRSESEKHVPLRQPLSLFALLSSSQLLYLSPGHMCSLCLGGGFKKSQDPPPLQVAAVVPSLMDRLWSVIDVSRPLAARVMSKKRTNGHLYLFYFKVCAM